MLIHTKQAANRSLNGITIIGRSRNGRPIYSIAGGAGEGEGEGGSGEGEGGSGEEGDGSGSGEGGSGEGEGASGSEGSGKGDEGTMSKGDLEAALERMKAADRRASEAEKKVREYEDKDKSELERLQRDHEEASTERDTLRSEAQELRVKLAVLSSAGSRFNDPEDVLRFVDYSDVSNDEGEIDKKAVDAALEKLAEDKPYLLRKEESGDGEGEGGEGGPPSTPKPNGGKRKDGIDKDALFRKYPALRR